MKRTLLAISLITVLFAPLLFTGVWFHFQKKQIKREVKHRIIDGIEKEELVKFEFSLKESIILLDWEHSKEFEFKGEMYDVVFTEYSEDKVIYYCWWDNKETKLNKQLAQNLEEILGGKSDRNTNKISYFKLLKSLYLEQEIENHSEFTLQIEQHFNQEFNLCQTFFKPTTPPPNPVV